jgi:hypothetical protein
VKNFFVSDPPAEPVDELIDPNVQYITAEYDETLDEETVVEETEAEVIINTSYQML